VTVVKRFDDTDEGEDVNEDSHSHPQDREFKKNSKTLLPTQYYQMKNTTKQNSLHQ
jgi:hypothetical protein